MTILTANWAILRIYSTAACSKPAIWWHSMIVCAWRRANCKPTNFERFLFSIEKKNNAIKLYHNDIDWPYLYIVAANLCAKKRMGVCHWPMKCCRPYRKKLPKNSVRAFTHWIWATTASSKTIDDLNFCYFFCIYGWKSDENHIFLIYVLAATEIYRFWSHSRACTHSYSTAIAHWMKSRCHICRPYAFYGELTTHCGMQCCSSLGIGIQLSLCRLNKCDINNLPKWIQRLKICAPNLRQLSLLGNPGALSIFNGASSVEHNDYM